MSQPQLSVREKAREMFDERFEYMSGGYYASRMGRHAVHPDDFRNFIDQIITLAQEEKIKEVEKLTWVVYPDQADGEILVEQKGYNSALQDVINILKQ